MKHRQLKTLELKDPDQRKALSSPLRLEILGLFTTQDALSVADMAERMGRPAPALYYHIRLLDRVGILKQVGRRSGTKRDEALYRPVAERFAMPADPQSRVGVDDAAKTLASAFRMAERDFNAAMHSENIRHDGPHRNIHALRLHCRLGKDQLRELNQHLREIERLLAKAAGESGPPVKGDQYLSLTLALLPLRGRNPN